MQHMRKRKKLKKLFLKSDICKKSLPTENFFGKLFAIYVLESLQFYYHITPFLMARATASVRLRAFIFCMTDVI